MVSASNINEHWDETGGRSAEKLATDHLDVTPGAILFTTKELWVGMVPFPRVWAWLARVRDALIKALESAGTKVPDDMSSIVEFGVDLSSAPLALWVASVCAGAV